jgi:hypothetical protein
MRQTPGLVQGIFLFVIVVLGCGTPTGSTTEEAQLLLILWHGPPEDPFAPPLPPRSMTVATWGIRLRSTFITETVGAPDRARLIPSESGTKHVDVLRDLCCNGLPIPWRVDYQVEVPLPPPGPHRLLWTHTTLRDGSEMTEVVLDTTITVR